MRRRRSHRVIVHVQPTVCSRRSLLCKKNRLHAFFGLIRNGVRPVFQVKVRRLPLYSELLSRLGTASAGDLTRSDIVRAEGSFCDLWFRHNASSKTRESPARVERRSLRVASTRRNHDGEDVGRYSCTRSVEKEIEIVQQILLRREALGVERWLQLQRCSARVDRW